MLRPRQQCSYALLSSTTVSDAEIPGIHAASSNSVQASGETPRNTPLAPPRASTGTALYPPRLSPKHTDHECAATPDREQVHRSIKPVFPGALGSIDRSTA